MSICLEYRPGPAASRGPRGVRRFAARRRKRPGRPPPRCARRLISAPWGRRRSRERAGRDAAAAAWAGGPGARAARLAACCRSCCCSAWPAARLERRGRTVSAGRSGRGARTRSPLRIDDAGRDRDASPPLGRAGAEPGRRAQVRSFRPLGIRKAGLKEAGGALRPGFPVPAPGPRGRPVSRWPCQRPREPEARWGLGASDAQGEELRCGWWKGVPAALSRFRLCFGFCTTNCRPAASFFLPFNFFFHLDEELDANMVRKKQKEVYRNKAFINPFIQQMVLVSLCRM